MTKLLMAAALAAVMATPAFAQTAVGVGTARSNAQSQAIGVGNNFGAQSNRNANAFSPTSTVSSSNSISNRFSPTNTVSSSNTNSSRSSNRNTQIVNVLPADPPSKSGANGWHGGHSHSGSRNVVSTGNGLTGGNFAPSVYAPGLAQSSGQNCASSISFGVSGPGAGLSFGFPFQGTGSERCDARLSADMFRSLGLREAAVQRMCESDADGMALASAGIRCRVGKYAVK